MNSPKLSSKKYMYLFYKKEIKEHILTKGPKFKKPVSVKCINRQKPKILIVSLC